MTPGRAGRIRLSGAGALVTALLLAALMATLAACGGDAGDPFAGLFWEPSTGRRVEILREGDAYRLVYGAGKRAFPARREGDELRVAEPMGGEAVLRPGADAGTLLMTTGGETTLLRRVPQHQ